MYRRYDRRVAWQKRKPSKPYTYERSWNYVLWLLSRKAYTRAQLREKLVNKEAEAEVVERVMAKLEDLHFVDDEAFADAYVRSRMKQKGRIALRRDLYQKGVDEEIVDKTLEPLETTGQVDTAVALLIKNAWRFQKEDPRKNRAKAFAYLARRGFTGDVVKEALHKADLWAKEE